ncbi:MAG: glycosyltransferase [Candidatus Harrisonbacteria bacterium]|nr:glycosyltransferase [Candidatus Harrisonbacteria bacterium]
MPITSEELKKFFDDVAPKREAWQARHSYYHGAIRKTAQFFIPKGSAVLDVGSGTGDLLASVAPKRGVGVDVSPKMTALAAKRHPTLTFFTMDAEHLTLSEPFDHIICSDLVSYLPDVQRAFMEIKKVAHDRTKILITYTNFLWEPLLRFAEFMHLKMSSPAQNWLSAGDLENLLHLAGFEVVKRGEEMLLPVYIPLVSYVVNRFIARLPLIRRLCILRYAIAKPRQAAMREYTTSVIIPARNEKGNIEAAVLRTPQLGRHMEIIFVEGGSKDGTREEIQRVIAAHKEKDITLLIQDGKGKGNAMRKGFAAAKGDVLFILDADLTVPPEDLPKFYSAIASGAGEFINGSRLVYQMERQAMQTLNHIARAFFGDFDPFGDFDLLFGAAKLGLKIIDLPIRYAARTYGSTNISRWKHGWLLLKMTAFSLLKMKFF